MISFLFATPRKNMLFSLMLLLPVIVSAAFVRRRSSSTPPFSGKGPALPPIEQDRLPEYVIKTWSTVLWTQRAGGSPASWSALAGSDPDAKFHVYNPYEQINATPPPLDSVKDAVASLEDCVDLCNANGGVVPFNLDKCNGSGWRGNEDPECYCKKNDQKVWRRRETKCWRWGAPLFVYNYKNQASTEECPADMDLPLTFRYVAEEDESRPWRWLQLEEQGQRLRMQLFPAGTVKSVTKDILSSIEDLRKTEPIFYKVVEDTGEQTVFAGHSEGGGWSWAVAKKLLEKASPHPAPVHIITTGTLTIDPTFTKDIYEQIRASGGSVTNYVLGVRVKKEDVRSFDEWGIKVRDGADFLTDGTERKLKERIISSEQTGGDYIDLFDLMAYDSNKIPGEKFYPYPTFFMCEWEAKGPFGRGRFTTCVDDGASAVGEKLFKQIEKPDYEPNAAMHDSYKSLPSVFSFRDLENPPPLTKNWLHRFDSYRDCLQLCFDKFRSTFSGSSSEAP